MIGTALLKFKEIRGTPEGVEEIGFAETVCMQSKPLYLCSWNHWDQVSTAELAFHQRLSHVTRFYNHYFKYSNNDTKIE